MTSKLARWSFVLALPFSAVIAAPAERAVEVPLKANGMSATTSTTSKSGSTHQATATRHHDKTLTAEATPVREHRLSMRDVAPTPADNDGVYHSVHDWVPRTPTKASTQAQDEESNHAQRTHWWSRPKNVASAQKAEEVKP